MTTIAEPLSAGLITISRFCAIPLITSRSLGVILGVGFVDGQFSVNRSMLDVM